MKDIKIIFVAALLMLICPMTFADNYTVGLRKLMDANSKRIFNMDTFTNGSESDSIANEQMKTMVIDILASCYRKNMPENEFNQMVEYCNNPEHLELDNRIQDIIQNDMQIQMQENLEKKLNEWMAILIAGEEPELTKRMNCSQEFEEETKKVFEDSNLDVMKNMLFPFLAQLINQGTNNGQEDTKIVIQKLLDCLMAETKIMTSNTLIKKISIEDLHEYNKITEQPFYANMQKAKAEFMDNIVNMLRMASLMDQAK